MVVTRSYHALLGHLDLGPDNNNVPVIVLRSGINLSPRRQSYDATPVQKWESMLNKALSLHRSNFRVTADVICRFIVRATTTKVSWGT